MTTRTTQDLVNSVTREVKSWRIKVVHRETPNADGSWVDCGMHQFPERMGFRETANRLSGFCPRDHEIVAIEAQ